MARVELVMPKMGESIIEATILKWSKQPGDKIEQDETVLEIATDKVDSEVPAPVAGLLLEQLFAEGAVAPVGAVIAYIETDAVAAKLVSAPAPALAGAEPEKVPFVPVATAAAVADAPAGGDGRFYSPLVLNIARQEGISMVDLGSVPGSGREGRVSKKDILEYVKNRASAPAVPVAPAAPAAPAAPVAAPAAPAASVMQEKKFNHGSNYDIVEMDRLRRIIAENMVYSKRTSAHVTSFVEADMTHIVMWRNKMKDAFEKKYGEKLTFTPIFVWAVAKALREMPGINVSVDGYNILRKKDINVGVAVALPSDNLIVPVIRNADQLNLAGLAARINDLAKRARENKLKPEELEGGTYTISNVGTFGNVMGTPVIMQPQVAIMATGAIRKIPAVLETPAGDVIAIRSKMFLSHTYDHRVIDGALGGRFVRRVADLLEDWAPDTEI